MQAIEIVAIVFSCLIVAGVALAAILRKKKGKTCCGGCCGSCKGCSRKPDDKV